MKTPEGIKLREIETPEQLQDFIAEVVTSPKGARAIQPHVTAAVYAGMASDFEALVSALTNLTIAAFGMGMSTALRSVADDIEKEELH